MTPNTQGICLDVKGDTSTRIEATFNDHQTSIALGDLLEGARVGYINGLLSPAYCFHRAVTPMQSISRLTLTHESDEPQRDWYTVRVRQKNNQWAWSSPIWVEANGE
jgi:hypothetical protein